MKTKIDMFKSAVAVTFPVFLGYMAIGVAFGLMLVTAGYPWWLAPIMSVFIYAGAGQYIAVPMFVADAGIAEIAMVTLMVNSRHVVYGLSLIDKFKGSGFLKPYFIFALTDETYGLLTTVEVKDCEDKKYFYFFVILLNHIYWVAGGLAGAIAGALIPFNFKGLDFALTALFVVLLIEQIKKCRIYKPLVLAFIVAVLAYIVVGKSNMLIVSILISVAGVFFLQKGEVDEKSQ